jgi:hypothetical protein
MVRVKYVMADLLHHVVCLVVHFRKVNFRVRNYFFEVI